MSASSSFRRQRGVRPDLLQNSLDHYSPLIVLNGPDELDQRLLLLARELAKQLDRRCSFAIVSQNSLAHAESAAIVQESGSRRHPPQGGGAPIPSVRFTLNHAIIKCRAHVMEKQVGIEERAAFAGKRRRVA